ncbi:MAG: hypothetical protein ACOCWA_03755 [Bacteroidota bacterium]
MIYFLLFISLLHVIEEDFRKIFGEDYAKALRMIEENHRLMDSLSNEYKIDLSLTKAIIFPELIRYNLIRDLVEKNTLEIVYINTGMADFSIGPMQIKPSFAERVEKELQFNPKLREFKTRLEYNSDNPVEIRKERLERLKSFDKQVYYVFAFQKYMKAEHPFLRRKNREYQLRFLSTAYNYDFQASRKDIEEFMEKSFFPWGRFNDRKKYNYADISWYYYQNEINKE